MLKINPKIFENNPGLLIGVLVVKNIDNTANNSEIKGLLRGVEAVLREKYTAEEINQHSHIITWREAHKKFGNDPKRYLPSVWAVTKRVVKGGELPTINNLVDLYNYICLKYVVPVGGEDLDKCAGDIVLDYARGDEEFLEIGGSENNLPQAGEIVYKDDRGVLCRKFNWREADRTKLTNNTQNAILVIEVLPPVNRETLGTALEELKELVQKYCGGDAKDFILDISNVDFAK